MPCTIRFDVGLDMVKVNRERMVSSMRSIAKEMGLTISENESSIFIEPATGFRGISLSWRYSSLIMSGDSYTILGQQITNKIRNKYTEKTLQTGLKTLRFNATTKRTNRGILLEATK